MQRKPGKVVSIRRGLTRQIEQLVEAREAEPTPGVNGL